MTIGYRSPSGWRAPLLTLTGQSGHRPQHC